MEISVAQDGDSVAQDEDFSFTRWRFPLHKMEISEIHNKVLASAGITKIRIHSICLKYYIG